LAYTLAGSLLGAIILYIYLMQSRPELQDWHLIELKHEFSAKKSSKITTFSDYLSLEEKLFEELQQKIYQKPSEKKKYQLIRYDTGSLADPTTHDINWNRSFVLPHDNPVAGVLLLHGLSDSPYSLRNIAQSLHKQGYSVLGLRMPGHGTVPSGLVHSNWQDMAAAVKLAVRHLHQGLDSNQAMHIIGYSMGAAQAVNYALDSLQDNSLPRPESLVLISPAIGVSSVAALASWQSHLSNIPGLEKLAWNSIGPEYDPYKYNSFAINAGDLMYRLTLTISDKLNLLNEQQRKNEFPRMQVFQSAVDATVSTSAVIMHLMDRVGNNGNELILFDINRNDNVIPFLKNDPGEKLDALMKETSLSFRLSLLTNLATNSHVLEERNKETDNTTNNRLPGVKWPVSVYSLSHVALPFPASDSLYGSEPDGLYKLHIGLLSPRGERGVLSIHASDLQRLRYNPFYAYQQQRLEKFLLQ